MIGNAWSENMLHPCSLTFKVAVPCLKPACILTCVLKWTHLPCLRVPWVTSYISPRDQEANFPNYHLLLAIVQPRPAVPEFQIKPIPCLASGVLTHCPIAMDFSFFTSPSISIMMDMPLEMVKDVISHNANLCPGL